MRKRQQMREGKHEAAARGAPTIGCANAGAAAPGAGAGRAAAAAAGESSESRPCR